MDKEDDRLAETLRTCAQINTITCRIRGAIVWGLGRDNSYNIANWEEHTKPYRLKLAEGCTVIGHFEMSDQFEKAVSKKGNVNEWHYARHPETKSKMMHMLNNGSIVV